MIGKTTTEKYSFRWSFDKGSYQIVPVLNELDVTIKGVNKSPDRGRKSEKEYTCC